MSIKIINITIPSNKEIPEIINTFSPEENYLMLKIGCDTLIEGRRVANNLTNEDIYKKIENDFKKNISILNNQIEIERQTSLKMQEKISKMYESQIEQLNKKLELSMIKITNYEQESKSFLEEELNKVHEKYNILLKEKDMQNQLNREVFDKAEKLINKNINKTSVLIGDDGEQIFENLTDTFKDFPEYKIENKAKQGHKGDFHLFFKDFNILVDSKNYTGSVQKKEILKIESDLSINDNMKFAWLVSLNSNVSDYNRFPIMTKWVTTDVGVKCILFINNLLDYKDPRSILRIAWFFCNDFYRLTKKTLKEDGEIEEYREKNLLYKKLIENLQERSSQLRRSINVSLNILKNIDNDLIEMLSIASDEVVNHKFEMDNMIKNWWNNNIEYKDDESKLTSTEIWNKFKKENKDYILDNKITIETFKDVITCNIVSNSNYLEKTKKGVIEFIGFMWREIEIKELTNLVIEDKELAIENKEITNLVTKKTLKTKKTKFYFSEEEDNKILKEYEDEKNNIMTISEMNNILPWQVVSLLIQYKVILKRNEARGHDIYKETDEYKKKINQ